MMSYPCIYNEEGTCKLHSTVYEHSWCVEGPCDDQTLSNGDRIRSMTDEELAGFLGVQSVCGYIQDNYYELCETRGVCNGCVLNWLKQPAEVET